MKKCYTCRSIKSLDAFNKNKSRKDGLNSICRPCSNQRSRRYYRENKKKHIKNVGKYTSKARLRNQQYIVDFLKRHPCVDCDETDIVILEFDHQKDKVACISTMVMTPVSLPTLQKEIAKCQVRCSNCHKRKTAKDQNWWILKYLESVV